MLIAKKKSHPDFLCSLKKWTRKLETKDLNRTMPQIYMFDSSKGRRIDQNLGYNIGHLYLPLNE